MNHATHKSCLSRLRRIEGDHQGPVYTQFRIPSDKIVRIDLGAGKVRALGKTGHVMEIAFDPSINPKVDVLRGDNTADLSSDTAGWRRVKPVTTVRFIGEMEQNYYTATFQITLLDHV